MLLPLFMILVFLVLVIAINRKNLGVESFSDYATGNRAFGFVGMTFGILSTWYLGAMYTAFAALGVEYGFIDFYCTIYALITLITMYLVAPRTVLWGKKYGLQTQSELLGFRYQSNTIRILSALWGILFTIPWLVIELITMGYVFNIATGGFISQFWGMVIGLAVITLYSSLGGMKSVITANVAEGILMLVGGIGLMVYLMHHFWGGYTSGIQMMAHNYPRMLTYPGPGWNPPTPYWTSIVILSGVGGFMWPWVYNKLFAADSVRSAKKTALLTPILGAIYWSVFVVVAIFLHSYKWAVGNPQGALLTLAKDAGPFALGVFAVIIIASCVGNVSGIMQAISTTISRDIAQVTNRNISEKMSIRIARVSVIMTALVCVFIGTLNLGLLVFLALFTYNGIIMLFPTIFLGLFWKRANKEGAILGLVTGTALSMILSLTNPSFINRLGWQPGVYGTLFSFIIMIVAGFAKKPTTFSNNLWNEFRNITFRDTKYDKGTLVTQSSMEQ